MLPGSVRRGRTNPKESIEVLLLLRPKLEIRPDFPRRKQLTHEEFERRYGARATDLRRVAAFAANYDLEVLEASTARRLVRLRATAARMERAFGIELFEYEHSNGTHRGHEADILLPYDLSRIIVGVVGLDNRAAARRNPQVPRITGKDEPPRGALTAIDIAKAYNFPEELQGAGQCIGIVELGGGYVLDDFRTYFKTLSIPLPKIVCVGTNRPRQNSHINMEVAMDLEVAASVAPRAKYVFYFAKANTPAEFINVMSTAIHDQINSPSVISVSWGASETTWSTKGAEMMSQVMEAGAALGITVCVGSGDSGASDGLPSGELSVSFPACVPSALACGGTRLNLANKRYYHEVVWNDLKVGGGATGGGVSALFRRPEYQKGAGVPRLPRAGRRDGVDAGFRGRGVPDVAGNACPHTGYLIRANKQWLVKGGTSAVAPLWAALIALLNEGTGRRAGLLNPVLYEHRNGSIFHQILHGNNSFFNARRGWSACTGLGTPDGAKLLPAMK